MMYSLYDTAVPEIAELKKLPTAERKQISGRAFNTAFHRPRGYLGAILLPICNAAGILAAGVFSGFDKSWWCIVPLCLGSAVGGLIGGALFMTLTGPLYLTYLREELRARRTLPIEEIRGLASQDGEGAETGHAISLSDPSTLPPNNKRPMPWLESVALMAMGGPIGASLLLQIFFMLVDLLRPLDPTPVSSDLAWRCTVSGAGFVLGALLFLRVGKGGKRRQFNGP
jgi:hypothetical protein